MKAQAIGAALARLVFVVGVVLLLSLGGCTAGTRELKAACVVLYLAAMGGAYVLMRRGGAEPSSTCWCTHDRVFHRGRHGERGCTAVGCLCGGFRS